MGSIALTGGRSASGSERESRAWDAENDEETPRSCPVRDGVGPVAPPPLRPLPPSLPPPTSGDHVQMSTSNGATSASSMTQPAAGSGKAQAAEPEKDLNNDVLNVIGQRLAEERTLAPPVHSSFAIRWAEILKMGLPAEVRSSLIKNVHILAIACFSTPLSLMRRSNGQ